MWMECPSDHVAQQFLGRAHAKMRALFALADHEFAVAIAMRHQEHAGFLAFLHEYVMAS